MVGVNLMFVFSFYLYFSQVLECGSVVKKNCSVLPTLDKAEVKQTLNPNQVLISCRPPYQLVSGKRIANCVKRKWIIDAVCGIKITDIPTTIKLNTTTTEVPTTKYIFDSTIHLPTNPTTNTLNTTTTEVPKIKYIFNSTTYLSTNPTTNTLTNTLNTTTTEVPKIKYIFNSTTYLSTNPTTNTLNTTTTEVPKIKYIFNSTTYLPTNLPSITLSLIPKASTLIPNTIVDIQSSSTKTNNASSTTMLPGNDSKFESKIPNGFNNNDFQMFIIIAALGAGLIICILSVMCILLHRFNKLATQYIIGDPDIRTDNDIPCNIELKSNQSRTKDL